MLRRWAKVRRRFFALVLGRQPSEQNRLSGWSFGRRLKLRDWMKFCLGIGLRSRQLRQETADLQERRVYSPDRENCFYIAAGIRTPQSNDYAGAKAAGAWP